MKRRNFIKVIGGTIVSWPFSVRAEQPNRVWRVGMLHVVLVQASPGFTAFRKKLGELRYVEGQNIMIETTPPAVTALGELTVTPGARM